jgi:hypothetical protein
VTKSTVPEILSSVSVSQLDEVITLSSKRKTPSRRLLGHRDGKGIAALMRVSSNGKLNLSEHVYKKEPSRVPVALLQVAGV